MVDNSVVVVAAAFLHNILCEARHDPAESGELGEAVHGSNEAVVAAAADIDRSRIDKLDEPRSLHEPADVGRDHR